MHSQDFAKTALIKQLWPDADDGEHESE